MTLYVSVAAHAITPEGSGNVGPGDTVELDDEIAAPYVAVGHLIAAPVAATAAPAPPLTTLIQTPKESDQ